MLKWDQKQSMTSTTQEGNMKTRNKEKEREREGERRARTKTVNLYHFSYSTNEVQVRNKTKWKTKQNLRKRDWREGLSRQSKSNNNDESSLLVKDGVYDVYTTAAKQIWYRERRQTVLVVAPRDQQCATRGDTNRLHIVRVSLEGPKPLPAGNQPDDDCARRAMKEGEDTQISMEATDR